MKKLSVNAIDLSTDVETFKLSSMAAMVELDEAAMESKFDVQKDVAAETAKAAEAARARAAETSSGMYCAAESDKATTDFGLVVPVPPASGAPPLSAPVVLPKETVSLPLQELPLSKPASAEKPAEKPAEEPAKKPAGSTKRRAKAPSVLQPIGAYEAARDANVQQNMEVLRALGLEAPPLKKQKSRTNPVKPLVVVVVVE